ncbi:MAG: electron transport complex subunit RsxC [Gammaproteobacteria bacterium]|nr:electron transport complex subunit RsxC [Gammaproteobacteria bacterium]MCP5423922.1 electron transport complex subunit RsxC [Gammaproteobacteria bacterium]MCP5459401.1 electron transport complex subunit RsxC [Gammaproteobacteria bacterium]
MKLFGFRGGVHPPTHKELSAANPIERLPMPERLYIPLQQHVGAPAVALVEVGQHVLKGAVIGHSQGKVSAPVHASTSGVVEAIADVTAAHPSGLPVRAVVLKTDGEDRWPDRAPLPDPFTLAPEDVARQVGDAGIVGLGGACFPSAVKLDLARRRGVETVLVNGAECEPYLTSDDRLMRERAEEIIDGVLLLRHATQAKRVLVVVEDNKPEAIEALTAASEGDTVVTIVKVPTRYPMGSDKQMIQSVMGMEVPAGARSPDTGVVVYNVGTSYAVHRALRFGEPLLNRIVTVSGEAIAKPRNLETPIGTLVSELLAYCGYQPDRAERLLMGGPMMGLPLPNTNVPIVKGLNGVLALTAEEMDDQPSHPCVRCGRCVEACPMGLMPLEVAKRAHNGDIQGAVDYGLKTCMACGSCAYACPAHIPLVQYLEFAKGELAVNQRVEQKAKATRQAAERRQARLEREEQAKAEAAAKRKAEREARKNKKATV